MAGPDTVSLALTLAKLPGLTAQQRTAYLLAANAHRAARAIRSGRPVYSRQPFPLRRPRSTWRRQPRDSNTGRWVALVDL
jgi:hypothetical protein